MSNFKIVVPTARTNFAKDPSQEGGKYIWTTAGSNYVSRVSTYTSPTLFGRFSMYALWVDNSTLVICPADASSSISGYYIISAYICGVPAWGASNGVANLEIQNMTGATLVSDVETFTYLDADLNKKWKRIWSVWQLSTDRVGDVVLNVSGSGLANHLWMDGVQMEYIGQSYTTQEPTTFIDGHQEDCYWVGEKYGISSRNGDSRMGGQIVDLDAYGLYLDQTSGMGIPPIENFSTTKPLGDGSEDQGERFEHTTINLVPQVIGSTQADLRAKRQALIRDLGPVFSGGADVKFIYKDDSTNAHLPRWITAKYDGGLEMVRKAKDGFAEVLGFRFRANDPFWRDIGSQTVPLEFQYTNTARAVALRNNSGAWDLLGPPGSGGTYTSVRAIVDTDEYIVFGGDFLNFDGIANADYMVLYNKNTKAWSAPTYTSTVLNGIVWGLAVAPDNDTVYVIGDFTNANGIANADYCCSYKTSTGTWAALGAPSTGITWTQTRCAVVDVSGNLIVGGVFSNWAGVSAADNIAKWNGSAWSGLGTGISTGGVYVLANDPSNGSVIVGGTFTGAGGASGTSRIARWDGSAWSNIGGGFSVASNVVGLHVDSDGVIYAGGNFTQFASGVTCNDFARYVGSRWEDLGGGVTGGNVTHLNYIGDLGIIISGDFTAAGGSTDAARIALWNGSAFAHLDFIPPGTANITQAVQTTLGIAIGYDTTGTATYGRVNTGIFVPLGTGKNYPIMHFKFSSGSVSADTAKVLFFANESTGAYVWVNYSLSLNEELIIDFRPRHRAMYSNKFNNRWAILPNSRLTDFMVYRTIGNDISVFVKTTGTPTIDCWIEWEDTYLGID